jgi:tungstate transport system substrate-binding protein
VARGNGLPRHDVMYNDFVIVGPPDDPTGISDMMSASEALAAIAAAGQSFASRGDDSGTNTEEPALWDAASIMPDPSSGWYLSLWPWRWAGSC